MKARRYRALLVCNGIFPKDPENLPTLNGPANDIRLLRSALVSSTTGLHGPANVRSLLDKSSRTIYLAAEAFFRSAERDDQLLFYYSGHGWQGLRGQLFLCARDTITDSVWSTTVKAEDLDGMMRECPATAVVVILDCCNAGAAFKGGADLPEGLQGEGRFVLTSSRSREPASDSGLSNHASPFTACLVDALSVPENDRDHDGYITVEDVYGYIRRHLRGTTAGTPQRAFDEAVDSVPLARVQSQSLALPTRTPRHSLGASVNLVPYAGITRAASRHDIAAIAVETSLAYGGWRIAIDRADLFEKLKRRSDARGFESQDNFITYTDSDLDKIIKDEGVVSAPPGSLFSVRIIRVRSEQEIVDNLREGHPVITGIHWTESWQQPEVMVSGKLPLDWRQSGGGGNANVVILGYDSSLAAFRFLSSWPSWGEEGYGWMPSGTAYLKNGGESARAIEAYEKK